MLLSLAAIVVFVVTYLLILPAITLENDVARQQGGIDVPAAEQTAEDPKEDAVSDAKAGTISYEGDGYTVSADFDAAAGLPSDTGLQATEITEEDEDYRAWIDEALKALRDAGGEADRLQMARFYDISLLDGDTPVEPSSSVGVTISYRKAIPVSDAESLRIIHFAVNEKTGDLKPQVLDANAIETSFNKTGLKQASFDAESFSVYAVVDAPEPAKVNPSQVATLEDLSESLNDQKGLILSYGSNKYFKNILNNKGAFNETGSISEAAHWFFEAGNQVNSYYIYTEIDGVKNYMYNTSGNLMGLSTENKTPFDLTQASDGKFYFQKQGEGKWLQHSNGGDGIRLWTDNAKAANSQISIWYVSSLRLQDDPYGLNGKTFGIVYNNDTAVAAALQAESKKSGTQWRLTAMDLLIRPNVVTDSGTLLVAENSNIQEWTFQSVEEDKYYLTTTVDGTPKYLTIDGGNVTLTDRPDEEKSLITATPGTGSNAGKWHFTVNGYSLSLVNTGNTGDGFNAKSENGGTTWLNLTEKSTLEDEDFVSYSARKISVSEEGLDQKEIIIYTRVWNDTTKKYEFYAVDHDGSLERVYDSGDLVNWVGNKANSALWKFTEYKENDGTPNYYYELENTAYQGTYLAPQSGGIVWDHKVGINLNGRREGFGYTTIVAWDDEAYAYSGLKVIKDDEGKLKVVTCPLGEADDFYFASMVPVSEEETKPLSTVETVDSDKYGITMKMVDFNNTVDDERDKVQNGFFYDKAHWKVWDASAPNKGLLSTNLGTDGYPIGTSRTQNEGASLSTLFNRMTSANHLFLQSVYNESGYFEYDSTQNYAHLIEDDNDRWFGQDKPGGGTYGVGDFVVYDQLAAIGTETKNTRAHGQFMPYNDISEDTGYAHDNRGNLITNKYNVKGEELPDSDPRKGEPLYSIPQNQADYYFGMELSANFTQTPNGEDNWGHDIIFEFTGDDDFWFYVDGELVLDLGGVHSALGGSVNFRTGEVVINNTKTSLYDVFRSNYVARGLDPDDVENLFVEKNIDGKTVHVFKDYTTHTMKMFFMERGAGASNLKMRFNLASVKPGTAELSKKLSGTSGESNKLMQYPYQIWYETAVYKTKEDGSYVLDESGNREIDHYEAPELMKQPESNSNLLGKVYATYKGTNTLIPYKESMTIDGQTYNNVFLLKAGETAVLNFTEDTYRYKIIECGVNTEVYEHVYVNGDNESENEIFGKPYNNTDGERHSEQNKRTETYTESARSDFGIKYASTKERPRVEYTNQVAQDAMRTVSFKKLVYGTDGEILTDKDMAEIEDMFNFRLYLGNEFASESNIPAANMYIYYLKDPRGNYCKWDKENQRFESLSATSFADFEELPKEVQRAATFTTSMNGSISKIPPGYTVEVRDLIIGTKYKVEERDWEIPKGYTRRVSDGYVRTDLDNEGDIYYTDSENGYRRKKLDESSTITAEAISDTIIGKNESPMIEIRNQEGWGLTAKKIWTDKDFMTHDDIYLAIYLKKTEGGETQYELLEDTVRRLKNADTEAYYFFPDLKIGDQTYSFNDFVVREVKLTVDEGHNLTVDDEGNVTVDENVNVTPVSGEDDNKTIEVGGTPAGGKHGEEQYTVSYATGTSTGRNRNIRTDIVTNSRPGIELYKTDWSGEWNQEGTLDGALAGTGFTLKDRQGNNVAAPSYTSDESGLITIAYLSSGTYTLTETSTPKGYIGLDGPITIEVGNDESLKFSLGDDEITMSADGEVTGRSDLFSVRKRTGSGMNATVTIKNRTNELKAVKVDAGNDSTIKGVHFALYRQVRKSDETLGKDYQPLPGFEDLVTNENGIIPMIDLDHLTWGQTYYLTETQPAEGYNVISEDLQFTIGKDGKVTVDSEGHASWLFQTTNSQTGQVSYTITIPNSKMKKVSFKKVDIAHTDNPLSGARFDLYAVTDGVRADQPLYSDLTSNAQGMLETGSGQMATTVFELPIGTYYLIETKAPDGYNMKTNPVVITVKGGSDTAGSSTLTGVTYDEKTSLSSSGGVSFSNGVYTLKISNSAGVELPASGGLGTTWIYLLGTVLLLGCGITLASRRRTHRA